jgi:protoporphyrinogen/coproporphyrinogen III oxidase
MPATQRRPIAIIGGGPAGISAAEFLKRHHIPFVLYEAGPKLAGLATSFHDTDGFSYDFGAHFITNRLAAATGIGAYCRDVRYYGESVLVRGKTYSYPFGLLQVPRYLQGGLAAKLDAKLQRNCDRSAAAWFQASYGKTLADEVALPLLEEWSGAPAYDLAASVGNKMQNSLGKTLMLRAASRLTGRAVSCGYSHEAPESPRIWHVYPEGGIGLLCEKLAVGLEQEINLESPVQAILTDGDRVEAIRVNDQEKPVSAVISTAPVNILSRMVQGTSRLDYLSEFRYRPMVFVNLRMEGRGYLKDCVLWTPESHFPFFRLTETPVSMPWLAPEGKTLITVDIGCEKGDEIWSMPDEQLGEFCIEHLAPIIPHARQKYLGCRVLRTPIAYPVYLNKYESQRLHWETSTGIEGLYSIGRNGEFSHSLMEDIFWRTQGKMQNVMHRLDRPTVQDVKPFLSRRPFEPLN